MKKYSVKTLTSCALMAAFALVLSYAESLLPLPLPIPGARLGLSNVMVLLALMLLGRGAAAWVLAVKVALSALLFGTPVSFLYAAVGGTLALAAMTPLNRRRWVSPVGQSVAGAVVHNLGQVLVAAALTSTPRLLLYFTPLALLGILTGTVSGLIAQVCAAHLQNLYRRQKP